MNIINKLTIRHLKENKRRTLVTIIGVIISVAMITAVATLGISFLNLMIRQEIATNGEWHVKYKNVNPKQLESIEKDSQTQKLIITKDVGYAMLEGSENESKPYLFIKDYNTVGFQSFPIELAAGRLPLAENEIVISEEIARNAKVNTQIGNPLTLNIGNRILEGVETPLDQSSSLQQKIEGQAPEELKIETTETFTIVGTIKRPTWEPAWSPGYTVIRYTDKSLVSTNQTVDAVVVLKKVKGSLYKHAEKLVAENGIEAVQYNDDLLRYYGVTDNDNLRMTLFSLAGIIMVVIIVGSVALIYNAFAISVSERSRHLGMLSSVGATKIQKRNSVFFEGAVIGVISIPLGIISGLVGIGITFYFINTFIADVFGTTEKLKLIVTPGSILVACLISIVTIFISTYIPARRASKVSAIDAIRQTQDVKLTGKAVKTSKLVRKLFGLEAEIGLKNLKRNKRRYQATVFSLVISIVLFLTVSFFTESLKKSIELSQDELGYDIQLTGSNITMDDLQPFSTLDHITESVFIKEVNLTAFIEEDQLPSELQEAVRQDRTVLQDGKYPYYVRLHGLDEKSFKMFATHVGVKTDSVWSEDKPAGIVIDQVSYQDHESGKFIETKTINTKPGNVLDLYSMNYENETEEYLNQVEIAALTDAVPIGIQTARPGGLNIIVLDKVFDKLVAENDRTANEVQTYLYMTSSDPLASQEDIEEMKDSNMYVYNVYQNRQQQEQLVLLMSVFTYGFITLISLISIANIFNTISTSISLRKREFAMLRSVGMTPKGFNKMINYESIFYGIKALLYGLPISGLVMVGIYLSMRETFEYGFNLPWMSIAFVVVIIFIIVGAAMLYSIQKIKKENIIDGLKQESI